MKKGLLLKSVLNPAFPGERLSSPPSLVQSIMPKRVIANSDLEIAYRLSPLPDRSRSGNCGLLLCPFARSQGRRQKPGHPTKVANRTVFLHLTCRALP